MAEDRTASIAKPRIEWIDIAKGIAIILVIIGHTFTSGGAPWKAIFTFHMPLFFILAGVTFKVKDWKVLLPTSAKRLLVPFILMFLLLTLISNPELYMHPRQLIEKLIFALAYQPKQLPWHVDIEYVGAIWFLFCMFVARIYLNALLKISERFKLPVLAQFIIVCVLAYIGVLIGRNILVPFLLDTALVAMMFMYFGYLFKTCKLIERFTRWEWVLLAIGVWIFGFFFSNLEMGARDYTLFPLATICACAGSLICVKISMLVDAFSQSRNRFFMLIKRYLAYMGKNSMAVFCIHCFESNVINWRAIPFLTGLPFDGLAAAIVRVIFVSLTMLLFTLL